MPDEPGFMVWLEAPYGYGKSVLAGQWAEELEGDGWRVAWLALAGRDPRALLAQRLSLPAAAPWGIIDEELWREPTLLVLEDLQGSEDLAPILQHHPGLVLLASRGHLPYLELPKLRTQGACCTSPASSSRSRRTRPPSSSRTGSAATRRGASRGAGRCRSTSPR